MKTRYLSNLLASLFWVGIIGLFSYWLAMVNVEAATTYTQSIKNGVISFTPVPVTVPPIVILPMPNMPIVDITKIMKPAIGKNTFDLRGPPDFAANFPIARTENNAEVRVSCPPAKMLKDDPLVKPNQPGDSHLHVFFGNTGVDANSTSASLLTTGNSTCDGGLMNTSSYWVPAIVQEGRPIVPSGSNMYYKTGNADVVQPLPHGIKMLAGDMKATTAQDNMHWSCMTPQDANLYGKDFGYIPVCAYPNHLIMEIAFPSCWNGKDLDSVNHKDHMSYTCDTAHSVHIPLLSYNIRYDAAVTDDTSKWRLASDMYSPDIAGGYSMHADYMEAWRNDPVTGKGFSDIWYAGCMLMHANCGNDKIGDGRVYQY